VNGEFGFGKPRDVNHEFSGMVGLPLALVIGATATGVHIVPFVTPEFGFGSEDLGGNRPSQSGQAFMLGAGLALSNPSSSIGANLGLQHVFVDGAKTQIGITITLGGR
jgi:hypothetical protein